MTTYTKKDLEKDINSPIFYNAMFDWLAKRGQYGEPVKISAKKTTKNIIDDNQIAAAKTHYDDQMGAGNGNIIMNMYAMSPEYQKLKNQTDFKNSIKKAAIIGGGGLAAILLGTVADQPAAKILLEGAGTAAVIGSPVALGLSYLKHRA
jgi:hypothetical protein